MTRTATGHTLIDISAEQEGESASDAVTRLNARWRATHTKRVLGMALLDEFPGRIAVSSSFGAESAVLLHLVAQVYRAAPVIFLETGMHFQETREYRDMLIQQLGLRDVRIVTPDPDEKSDLDPNDELHLTDTDACCDLRKVRPLKYTLDGFDAWITGRKRYQNATREDLPVFEEDKDGKIKVNPLANWSELDIATYIENNNLPPHPLVAQGYPSIGCFPCTSKVAEGEDPRAGRWRDSDKTECGIHITADGKIIRTGQPVDGDS